MPTSIVILKLLSEVCDCPSVTLIVAVNVVLADVPELVPLIVPLAVFKDKPPGNEPLATEYAKVASPVAVTCTDIALPAEKLPSVPVAVCHTGASETVKIAELDLTANPSGFSTLTK